MSIEERRAIGEIEWRRKFKEHGFDNSFELIKREWNTDHGRRVVLKCKRCGAEFSSWALCDIFKGRQSHLLCLKCGAASDGANVWARSQECDEAMTFYTAGHSVKETAEKFNVTINQINSAVKCRRLTNGKDWKLCGVEINNQRHIEATKRFNKYIEKGGRDYTKIKDPHKRRAVQYGCKYDSSVTLESLIKRDGLRCAICGELCDLNDRQWTNYGPTFPTIDHIIPMSKGGGHIWSNVQIAHALCNSRKGNKSEEA